VPDHGVGGACAVRLRPEEQAVLPGGDGCDGGVHGPKYADVV
jgi:hypothetical protein